MKFVELLSEADSDKTLYGGKASHLTFLIKNQFNVPDGFVINTLAFNQFIQSSSYSKDLDKLLSSHYNPKEVINLSEKICTILDKSSFPQELQNEISNNLKRISENNHRNNWFAVRSSATIEDSEVASFAGQADSFLYLNSLESIINGIKKCWRSLFTPRALLYIAQLNKKGYNILLKDLAMAVIVQKMINSDISGVLFTANVLNNNQSEMLINSNWGLGETIANNIVNPDTIIIKKNNCEIIKQIIGKKEKISIPDYEHSCTEIKQTNPSLHGKCCLETSKLEELRDLGLQIEALYDHPQDIEWAYEKDTLYILQTRPITTLK